jgi:hypothetical protein
MYITNGVGGHYDGLDVLDDPMPDYIDYGVSPTSLHRLAALMIGSWLERTAGH